MKKAQRLDLLVARDKNCREAMDLASIDANLDEILGEHGLVMVKRIGLHSMKNSIRYKLQVLDVGPAASIPLARVLLKRRHAKGESRWTLEDSLKFLKRWLDSRVKKGVSVRVPVELIILIWDKNGDPWDEFKEFCNGKGWKCRPGLEDENAMYVFSEEKPG